MTTDLTGKSLAFFGEFAFWPSYHNGRPADVAAQHGAIIRDTIDENLDFLVLGDKRGAGRAEAKKKAEKLRAKAQKNGNNISCLEIIDEASFREMVRIDLTGRSFCFFGGFDCCGGELDDALLSRMVEGIGGKVSTEIDDKLDYLVLGNRKGTGKIAASNKGVRLQEQGSKLQILGEESFLELVRTDQPMASSSEGMDFATFLTRLHGVVDQAKLGRAMKMLKSEVFKLYVHLNEERLVGVVRSQTGGDKVYSSWLTFDGKYGCAMPDLSECMGLQGTVCKHMLVLLVGLTRTGDMDAQTAYAWIKETSRKRPKTDDQLVAETFLQYKGMELGEIDWRPTETIPEDFYAY